MRIRTCRSRSAAGDWMAKRVVVALSFGGVVLGGFDRRAVAADAAATASIAAPATPRALHPLIVNGRATSSYPSTGALLLYDDATASNLYGLCSGTLIGCRTFLTAAHCVCPENATDAASCERAGTADPATLRVFLQHGGVYRAASVAIPTDYSFGERSDLALITLSEAVTGIAPSAINTTRRPDIGTAGTIVGFGTTAAGRSSADDAGIKRVGTVATAECPSDIPDATHVCWAFSGSDANTCDGDSGGPLFIDFGAGPVVAGVTSGGHSFDCLAPDTAFDSDVFVNRSWISATAGADLGTESCDLPETGSTLTTLFAGSGDVSAGSPEAQLQFEVSEGATVLRVGLNAQLVSGSAFSGDVNDDDLFIRFGSAPTVTAFDCADTNPTPFGFCTITAPHPGTWHVLVRRNQGAGAFQVTATTFAAASIPSCAGDCNHDGAVTVDELLTAVNIALNGDPAACPSCDANGDGIVTVDELVTAVGFALGGCPTG